MDNHALFTELTKVFADLYIDPADAKRIAVDAGLDLAQIPFDAKAINNWHNILAVAIRAGALDAVLDTALGEYARHQPLVLICERYRHFIAAGGQLPAPQLLTAQNIVVYQGIAPQPVDEGMLAAARANLAELPLDHIPPIATLPVGSRMPFSPNPLFVGREGELRQLATWLKGGETVAVGQMVAATGMGGMGKSQLAAAFVHHYGQYFQGGVFWLTMADPDSIPAQIAECGAQMTELRVDYRQLDLSTQVRLVLAAWQSDLPRLLIFDNCESSELLAQWRPPVGACRVLVTSRRSHFDAALGVQALPLPTLPRAQSIELLAKFPANLKAAPYTKEEMVDLDAIATALGDLPLALHLAGSFLARYRRVITPATYLTQLQNLDSLEHRSLQSKEISPTAHDQHVARTFALSYEQLKADDETDELALRVLAYIACFAPGELIPRDLLLLTINHESEDKADPLDTAMQIEDALLRLMELGLIEVEADGQVLLHRLLALFVQQVDREGYAEAERKVEAVILREAHRLNNTKIPKLLLVWQVHLRYRTDLAKGRLDEIAADLCNTFGYHLHMIGEYKVAKPYFERSLAIQQTVLGDYHPNIVLSLNNLGVLLQAMGELEAAKPYYEQALAINATVLGDQHPDTALSLNNLGALLQAIGELAAAKPYYEQALAINATVLGDQHPATAASLNNLGGLLQAMGDYPAAKPYLERSLAIQQTMLGDQHPDTARGLNNLGVLLQAMGDYPAAKPYYEQALAIQQTMLGDQHPHIAASFNNLGSLLQAMGDYPAAKPYYEQALAINATVLGDQHPATAASLNNLGVLLRTMGELEAAKPYYEQALAISETVLGDKHPDTVQSLNNLGVLLHTMGELEAAKPYYEQALAIRQQVLGGQHPYTALSLNNLGGLLEAMGDYPAAKLCYERSLAILENHLGSSHPYTETVRNNIAYLKSQNDITIWQKIKHFLRF